MVTIQVLQSGQWLDYLTLREDSFLCSWIVAEAAINHISIRLVCARD